MATIVVIDDSPTRSLALSRWLQRLGHGVHCHAGLQEVLEKMNPQRVDLLLVALVRDEGNGFDSGAMLQERGFSPILLLTDSAHATDDIWGRAQGLSGVVSWPFTEAILGRIVDEALKACQEGGDVCESPHG